MKVFGKTFYGGWFNQQVWFHFNPGSTKQIQTGVVEATAAITAFLAVVAPGIGVIPGAIAAMVGALTAIQLDTAKNADGSLDLEGDLVAMYAGHPPGRLPLAFSVPGVAAILINK